MKKIGLLFGIVIFVTIFLATIVLAPDTNPLVTFIAPTPDNNETINVSYVLINTSVKDYSWGDTIPVAVYNKSGEDPAFPATNTIDGDVNTWWANSDPAPVQWIAYDYEESYNHSSIFIYSDPMQDGDVCGIQGLYVSDDPNDWGNNLVHNFDFPEPMLAWHEVSFGDARGRYMKVVLKISQGGRCWSDPMPLQTFREFKSRSLAQPGNVESCLLSWQNTSGTWTNYSMTKVGTGGNVTCYYNRTNLENGVHKYRAYANDTNGNWGYSEERNLTVNVGCVGANYAFVCGDTINESCTMNANLTANGTCFTIGASNIVIDGAGYTINYSSTTEGYGIFGDGHNNITIKNFTIQQTNSSIQGFNIFLNNSNDSVIEYNNLTRGKGGVLIMNSFNSIIRHNYGLYFEYLNSDPIFAYFCYPLNTNYPEAIIWLVDDINITIYNNSLQGKETEAGKSNHQGTEAGIALCRSNYTNISTNTIKSMDNYGIHVFNNSFYNVVEYNFINGSNISGSANTNDGVVIANDSKYNNISHNEIYYCYEWGVFVVGSNNNFVFDNKIEDSDVGIRLGGQSDNNYVKGNNISITLWNGWMTGIKNEGANNIIENNDIYDSVIGISIWSYNSIPDNNTLINNRINSNKKIIGEENLSYGISVSGSNNNITNNYIAATNESASAVYFSEGANNNTISNSVLNATNGIDVYSFNSYGSNALINCTFEEIEVNGSGSINVYWYLDAYVNYSNGSAVNEANVSGWDVFGNLTFTELTDSSGYIPRQTLLEYIQNATERQYYTNYSINATKGNYISETQQVNLTRNKIKDDNTEVVLTLFLSNAAPSINLSLPENETTFYDIQDINFNFTATDDQNTTLNCSIYLDNVLNQTNETTQNGSLTNFLINGISYGSHSWFINCSDGELSNMSETRHFNINDTIMPNIYFNPNTDNNGTYSKNWIFVNVTCSDVNKDIVILNWNGTNESFDNNEGDIYWENKTGLSDGIYSFYAWCNDSFGNSNQTELRAITLDTTAPLLIIISPLNQTYNNATQLVNISASDLNLDSVWYNWNGTNATYSSAHYVTFNEGSNTLYAWANDSLGNINATNVTFTIDTQGPIFSNEAINDSLLRQNEYVRLNQTITDTNNVSVAKFNISGNYYDASQNGEEWYLEWQCTANGTYYWYGSWANDSLGNINSTTFGSALSWICDTVAPSINFVMPTPPNNSILTVDYVYVNITSDESLSNAILEWNNGSETNESMSGAGTNWYKNKTGLADGLYVYKVYGNDIAGNINVSETRYVTIDATTPTTNITKNASILEYNFDSINITWNASDENLDSIIFNITYPNGSLLFNSNESGTIILTPSNLTSIGIYNITLYANDSAGNENLTFDNFIVNDTRAPYFTFIPENLTLTYGDNVVTDFNATDDGVGLDCFAVNDSRFSINCSGYLTNSTSLAASVYILNITINDTLGNINSTIYKITINPSNSPCNLYFNETSPVVYGTLFRVFTDCDSDFILKRNGTIIENNSIQNLAAGSYLFEVNRTDNQNYTNTYDNEIFIINKATGQITLKLNNNEDNITITYGDELNASAYSITRQEITLLRNGTNITNENNNNIILGAGYYNYTAIANENENYTEAIKTLFVNVTKAQATGSLLLNGASENITVIYPQGINASFTNSTTATLYRNGTDITSMNNIYQNLSAGYYNFSLVIEENENHTGLIITLFANITKATSHTHLTTYPSSPINYSTPSNFSCWNDENLDIILYIDSEDKTSENGLNITRAAKPSGYNVSCFSIENENYTSSYNETNYIINKAQAIVYTYLNNSRENITIYNGTSIYLNSSLIAGEGIIKLYNNGTLINSGNNNLSNYTLFSEPGLYNISTIYEETENYSSAIDTLWVNVTTDNDAPQIILNLPNNNLLTSNTTITFNCSANDLTELSNIILWLNVSGWNANETKQVSGTNNESNFTKTFGEGTYSWSCSACDVFGNCNESFIENRTFTIDKTAPIITEVNVTNITVNGATITWNTDENANSTVNYGTTLALGTLRTNDSFVTSHLVALTGLTTNTLYYFNVTSCDLAGNCNVSGYHNFTTLANGGGGGRGGGSSGSDRCGNRICDVNENCSSCPVDCGSCCGNTICEPYYNESYQNCWLDCCYPEGIEMPNLPFRFCCSGLVAKNLYDMNCVYKQRNCEECKMNAKVCVNCGNGVCGLGENYCNCPQDCNEDCGNGICESEKGENNETCPADCIVAVCGNHICEVNETENCPQDCYKCGNKKCEVGETFENCCEDCGCNNKLFIKFKCINNSCVPKCCLFGVCGQFLICWYFWLIILMILVFIFKKFIKKESKERKKAK